jgi:hypothetical protein
VPRQKIPLSEKYPSVDTTHIEELLKQAQREIADLPQDALTNLAYVDVGVALEVLDMRKRFSQSGASV